MTLPPRAAILAGLILASCHGVAEAKTKVRHRKPASVSMAKLNLAPTGEGVGRPYVARGFQPDRVPTHAEYGVAPLVSGSIGYQTSPNARIIAPYEVNQAAATRFGAPDTTLGASMAYKF